MSKIVEFNYDKSSNLQYNNFGLFFLNIYLHDFDLFMQKKINETKKFKQNKFKQNKFEYIFFNKKIFNLKQIFNNDNKWIFVLSDIKKKDIFNEILELEKKRNKLFCKMFEKNYKIFYCRYIDNFFIGIKGTKEMAKNLMIEINNFLFIKLKLFINQQKIISINSNKIFFLGTHIKIKKKFNKIMFCVPIKKIIKILSKQQFCDIKSFSKKIVIPKKKINWINLELYEIIENYNFLLKRIINYYSFAYNRKQLNFIQKLLQHSAACTFMSKLKMKSRFYIFNKFGFHLTVNKDNDRISLLLNNNLKRINKFNKKIIFPDEIFNYSICTLNDKYFLK